MSITSEELNYLVWRYLQETGNELTALALQEETRVLQFESSYGQHIPVGTLVNLVQKGILYTESELLLESCEFAEGSGKDNDQALRQKFNENFNLVDALRVDKEKYPEIKQSGRFALAHSGESTDNEDSRETATKWPISMTLLHEFITRDDTKGTDINTGASTDVDVITVTNSMWNPVNPTLVCLSENDSTSRIYRIKRGQDDNNKLVCQPLAILKHPFALSSSLSSNGDGRNTTNEITAMAWSHNGELLVTGVENGEIRLWNKQGTLKNVFSLHEYPIVTLSWNPDSTYFVSLDLHNVAILWNAITGTVVRHYPLLQRARAWSTRFVMGGSGNRDHHQHKYRHSRPHTSTNNNDLHSNSESKDVNGTTSAGDPVGYNEMKPKRNRDETSGANDSLASNETQLLGVAIEWIDKNKFVLPSVNGDLMVYQTDDEEDEPLGRLSGHLGAISCLAYNESNRMLLSAADDMTIRLWYGGNSNAVNCLYGHSQTIVAVDWIDDTVSVVSSSMDGTVRVWSVDTGDTRSESTPLVGIRLFDGIPIFSAELSHDRRSYCVGLMDGKVYVLDLDLITKAQPSSSSSSSSVDRFNTPMEIPILAEYTKEQEEVDMTKDENRQETSPVSVYSVSWSSDDRKISVVYSNGTCSVLEVIRRE